MKNYTTQESPVIDERSRRLKSISSRPDNLEEKFLEQPSHQKRYADSVSLPKLKNPPQDKSKNEEFKTKLVLDSEDLEEKLLPRKPKKKTKKRKRIGSKDRPKYLQPINRDVHHAPMATPPETKFYSQQKKPREKKKTQEQIERDEFVEAFLEKNSHVMHVKSQQYGLKPKKEKFKQFNLKTDGRANEQDKVGKLSKNQTKSVPIGIKTRFGQEEKKDKATEKSSKRKAKGLEMAKAVTEPPKPEPFLDFEKYLDIEDNFMIESELTKDQVTEWRALKDQDDSEDFCGNEDKLEKKFRYCYKDLNKKKSTKLIQEPSLISIEAIVQNHPALRFLNHDLLVNILKERDIE